MGICHGGGAVGVSVSDQDQPAIGAVACCLRGGRPSAMLMEQESDRLLFLLLFLHQHYP